MRRNFRTVVFLIGLVFIGLGLLSWKWWFKKKASPTRTLEVEELQALPYIQWSDQKHDSRKSGVTVFDASQVSPGYNLYTNDVNEAFLMDLSGRVVHEWSLGKHKQCEYVSLLPSKELLSVCMGEALLKVDWESKIIWRRRMLLHHDVEPLPDGSFLTIRQDLPKPYGGRLVVFDSIQRVSESGELLEKWSTYDHLDELRRWHKPSPLEVSPGEPTNAKFDYYHLNTIKLLPENPLGKKDPRFRPGNLLICLRNVNLVAILDKETMKVVWGWGVETLDWPHMPTMLPNGNILLFDNGIHRKFSRVLELNPITKTVTWIYKQEPRELFFSGLQGSAQRLENGNTLICEAGRGHVFEVTQEGKIVWDFWNPVMKAGSRKTIYRFLRVPESAVP